MVEMETSLSFDQNSHSSSNITSSPHNGKQLLHQLKTFEKLRKEQNSDDCKKDLELQTSILDTLSSMQGSFFRRGLLDGNIDRANEIQNLVSSNNQGGTEDNGGGGGKRRKKGGASKAASRNISSMLNLDGMNASSSEECYIFSSLSRILIHSSTSSTTSSDGNSSLYPPIFVRAAADVIASICSHCSCHLPSAVSTIEHSMVSSIGSQFLSGLSRTMKNLIPVDDVKIQEGEEKAIVSCCRCASTIITLVNIRLSRNTACMKSIRDVAELILFGNGTFSSLEVVTGAAANLLAVIPMASDSLGTPPSKLWTKKLRETALALSTTLNTFFPLLKKSSRKRDRNDTGSNGTNGSGLECMQWIQNIQSTVTSQSKRLEIFTKRVQGFSMLATQLLKLEDYGTIGINTFALPVTSLLDMLEYMLAFPSIAESRYLATKSKLRDISIDGGLLSPKSALLMANSINERGHSLFQAVISLLKSSSLQFGYRLLRISVSSLQSSSSNAVQNTIDPSFSNGKHQEKKCLNNSIHSRILAIKSFGRVVQAIGSNAIASRGGSTEKGLLLVVGCLLEQLSMENASSEPMVKDGHFGTVNEKAKLAATCVNTLATCVTTFGGFIPHESREMIESITFTCLNHVQQSKSSSAVGSYADVKVSILKLGISCISTPWPDGALSTLGSTLHKTASLLKHDTKESVSEMAYSAQSISNTCITPRSPPLIMVTRERSDEGSKSGGNLYSHAKMMEGLEAAKEDIERARKRKETTKSNNAEKKKASTMPQERVNASPKLSKRQKVEDSDEKEDVLQGQKAVEESQEILREEKTDKSLPPSIEIENEKKAKSLEDESQNIEKASTDTGKEEVTLEDDVKPEQETKSVDSNVEDDHFMKDTKSTRSDDEEDESDDDFPPIVDCGPDEDDM